MRIHYFQHVPFETPANIENWAKERGYIFKGTNLYKNQPFPDFSSFDMLVIMGGPMGVYDEDKYPFLKREKVFIENAIKLNKKVVGICLGAQLISDVLGAKVYKNREKETGWYPVYLTDEGKKSNIFKDLPTEFMPFHWHGDTFDIPNGAIRTAYNEATPNQAFEFNNGNVVALQFHLEVNEKAVENLIKNSNEEVTQTPEEMLSKKDYFKVIKYQLYSILNNLEKI